MNTPISADHVREQDHVTLDDKYKLATGYAWMSGTHALVRLALNQQIRDQNAGLNTAGFISGYRGSPLGGLDQNLWKAAAYLKKHHIVFQPGVNEDLAATSVWGSQQVNLFQGAQYDGVFGMWYGKGPGVDRSGDVFKHANAAGTSPHGGVLVIAGDDHPAKSSTLPHQSDHILKACGMPVLFPANVQEILDYGILGWAMSRYAGVWVGMKCITDIVEASASVEVDANRVTVHYPKDFELPPGGLNIRLNDTPLAQEARLLDQKLYAALAFARANGLNRELWSIPDCDARFGIITSGKAFLDTTQALVDLGLTPDVCRRIGLRLFKVGMVWPLESTGLLKFSENLDEILVVEEKRQMLEYQVKEELFGWIGRGKKIPRVVGKFDDKDGGEWAVPQSPWLLPAHYEFSPSIVARAIASRLLRMDLPDDVRAGIQTRLDVIDACERELARPRVIEERKPWFCSGCPHNTSTRVPEGSRAMAGIGCHYMALWMDRSTHVFTQMGGEGAPWIGQAPFTSEKHVFVNLGDGTYFHSGLLAIRAAVAAKVNVTYKILFNDAVAMTGGQPVDGQLTVPQLAAQVLAEGVKRLIVVTDEPEKYASHTDLPGDVRVAHRDELDQVQKELRECPGTTALIYDQTCATEKRRRRKRDAYPDPARRVVIHSQVCEGCGDCSVQSNCLSIEPIETEFGRKRTINQSSCNKDYSCLKGFCPSMVTIEGGKLRKPELIDSKELNVKSLPDPVRRELNSSYGIFIAGVGGTGVVTIGQLLGMAAHIEGKAGSVLDMAGLAQKGGAVYSHAIIASTPSQILNSRIAMGQADLVLGADLVVGSSTESIARMRPGHTRLLLNTDVAPTAAFIGNPNWTLATSALRREIEQACGEGRVANVDAVQLAIKFLGDAVYANPLLMGFAYQKGWIPLNHQSIEQAIVLNGVQVQNNLKAFDIGRQVAHDPALLERGVSGHTEMNFNTSKSDCAQGIEFKLNGSELDHLRDRRAAFLCDYQNAEYAKRYVAFVNQVAEVEMSKCGSQKLAMEVARNLFKLMAYKDEYEVARLYTMPEFLNGLNDQFEGEWKINFYLAPPMFARHDEKGHLIKTRMGPYMLSVFKILAKLKGLRGTPFDLFGYADERKTERALIAEYRETILSLLENLSPQSISKALQIASVPQEIRGFGHVKQAALVRAQTQRIRLLNEWNELNLTAK